MIALDFASYQALVQLYADYAQAVDSGDWDLWPEFFVDECSYRLVPRENHELSRSGEPKHRVERLQHIVGWMDQWLQGKKNPAYTTN